MEKPAVRTYLRAMNAPTVRTSYAIALAGALFPALAGSAAAAGCGGVVQTGQGDSALALAQRCGTTVQELRLANPGIDMNRPLGGQIVKVPGRTAPGQIPDSVRRGAAPAPLAPLGQSPAYRQYRKSLATGGGAPRGGSYTIRRGDTLSAIARRANVPLDALLAANPGIRPRFLAVGQTIVLPTKE